VSEPASCVSSCDGQQGCSNGFLQGFMSPGSSATESCLPRREGFFDRGNIGRGRGQKKHLAIARLTQLTHVSPFVTTQSIHTDDLPFF
jgi:hypothetical protein